MTRYSIPPTATSPTMAAISAMPKAISTPYDTKAPATDRPMISTTARSSNRIASRLSFGFFSVYLSIDTPQATSHNTGMDTKLLCSIPQYARHVGVSRQRVWAWIRRGRLDPIWVAGRPLIDRRTPRPQRLPPGRKPVKTR